MRHAVALVLAVALLAGAEAAGARPLYATNSADGTVSVLDTASGRPLAPPIAVGPNPVDVAIAPDGHRAYVANEASGTVSVIDTAANAVVGTVPVGAQPRGVAVSPDGTRVYVTSAAEGRLYAIDTATGSLAGTPVEVGGEPEGVAVTPDGVLVLVARRSGGVVMVRAADGSVAGILPNPLGPARIAVFEEGDRAIVTNNQSDSATIFSLLTGTVHGVPIVVGPNPTGVAIVPGGPAYAFSTANNTAQRIDRLTHTPIGSPIGGFAGPRGAAASPDGNLVYAANGAAASLSVLDTRTNAVTGQLPVGNSPSAVAIVPNQGPSASFTASARGRRAPGVVDFDASGSRDPDGRIARYDWDFGDGETESTASPLVEHSYRRPGPYRATVQVTDDEGCSILSVFTGQTASCVASPRARFGATVTVPDLTPPLLVLRVPAQRLRPRLATTALCRGEACRVRVAGVLRVTVPGRRGSVVVLRGGVVARRLGAGIAARVSLPLPPSALRAARRALGAGGSVRFAVRAVARDEAANETRRRRTARLSGPRRPLPSRPGGGSR